MRWPSMTEEGTKVPAGRKPPASAGISEVWRGWKELLAPRTRALAAPVSGVGEGLVGVAVSGPEAGWGAAVGEMPASSGAAAVRV